MTYYAVIDTNVLVSYFITKNTDSPIVQVVNAIRDNIIIPLFEESILEEYTEVLYREKFGFDGKQIEELLSLIREQWPCRISSRNDDNYRTGNDSARVS